MSSTPLESKPAVTNTKKEMSSYADLRRLIVAADLESTQPVYYATEVIVTLCLFALTVSAIPRATNLLFQIGTALFLAFVSTRLAFIVHDAGHKQIFRSRRQNRFIGVLFADLLLGFSYSSWVENHNRHHRNPNQCGLDPDIEFPLLAFSNEQALEKTGIARLFVKYQAYCFFPLLLLEAIALKINGFRFLLTQRTRSSVIEIALITFHHLLWFSFLLHFLGGVSALAFAAAYYGAFGLSLGMIFVTNHGGMPLLDKNTKLDFVTRQIATSRDLRVNPLVDHLFGGLTCQIEHHLFPTIPRNRLRKAKNLIRTYCLAHGIKYYETGLWQCYREVINHLHDVGANLR